MSIFSEHKGIKLEINNRRPIKISQYPKMNSACLINPCLINPWFKKKIIRETRKCFELNENSKTTYISCSGNSLLIS